MTVRRVRIPKPVCDERHLTVVSTRGMSGGIVAFTLWLLFLAIGVVPLGVAIGSEGGVGAWAAAVVCGALGAAGIVWVTRQWRLPLPDTVVSDIGVLGDATSGWSNDIRWKQLHRNPQGPFDVWVAMSTRTDETLRWLHFFTAERPADTPVERKLRLLIPQKLGGLWYGNAFALRRAVLLQLATRAQPPLRFDPMLFVEMGVHPRRWTPMPWPGRVLALLIGAPIVAVFIGTFAVMDALPSVWWSVGILVLGMIASVVLGLLVFLGLYPAFRGQPYVFTSPD